MNLKGSKCEFFCRKVKYLCHIVSEEGIETDPEKLRVLREWPVPSTVKDLRRFLVFAGYYRHFCPSFAQLAKPLNELLVGHPTNKCKSSKSATLWSCGESQQIAFDSLIAKLTSPPILAYADYIASLLPFIVMRVPQGLGQFFISTRMGQTE